MFEWCSSSVISTSSPGPSVVRASPCATRLIASVVPRTKTISRDCAAPMKPATLFRTPSKAWVARSESS